MAAGEQFRFGSPLLRDVAYETQARAQRRRRHGRAALILEDEGREPGLQAVHWERADERERARACYLAAGTEARKRCSAAEVDAMLGAYLRLTDHPSRESVTARLDRAREALRLQERHAEADAANQLALTEARQLSDPEMIASALIAVADDRLREGRAEVADRLLREALDLSRRHALDDVEIDGRHTLARLNRQRGRVEEARRDFDQSIRKALDRKDTRREALLRGNLSNLLADLGQFDEARAELARCVDLARADGNRRVVGICLCNLASMEQTHEDIPRAIAHYEESLEIAREVGHRTLEATVLANQAGIFLLKGERERGRRLMEEVAAIHVESGNRPYHALTVTNLAEVSLLDGQYQESLDLAASALAEAQEIGAFDLQALALKRMSLAALDLARFDDAERFLQEAEAANRASGIRYDLPAILLDRSRLARLRGRLDECEPLVEAAREIYDGAGSKKGIRSCDSELALLDLARGGSGDPWAERALAGEIPDWSQGRTGRLRLALLAREVGRPLCRGEDPESLPPALLNAIMTL